MKNKDSLGTKDNKETRINGKILFELEVPTLLIIRRETLPGVGYPMSITARTLCQLTITDWKTVEVSYWSIQ